MSNFKKGTWCDIWDGLFWHFMDKQRVFFSSNPRLSMLVRNFDKMDMDKKASHLETAENFFSVLDEENEKK